MAKNTTNLLETTSAALSKLFTVTGGAFSLQQYPGFPYTEWLKRQKLYNHWQDWYDGVPLRETLNDDASGQAVDKFPIKINPIPNSCEKHATVLLGNNLESIRDEGVPISFSYNSDVEEERAKIINSALQEAIVASGGGAIFASNAIISQYLGGCVFGVAFRPQDDAKVQVIAPDPTEFIGVPDGLNYWSLKECWFVRKITAYEAKHSYGYPVIHEGDSFREYYYIEHWSKTDYRVSVNELTLTIDGVLLEGPNPYNGTVPFVYIPHIRTKGFWGQSLITEAIEAVITEMNLRFTDIGDAVSDDSHNDLVMRGIRNSVKAVTLPNGRKAVDIGSSPGLSANDTTPDLFAVRTQSASTPMLTLADKLENIYRREARHPAVADGEDEGSQRSSLTLTTRMLPLVSHIKLERINWTMGMVNLVKIILKVYLAKGLGDIVEEDLKCKPIIKWAPMLPRDREELVNEVAIRKKNGLLSQRHGLEMFQDVDDVEKEMALIEEDSQKAAELALKMRPPPSENGGDDEADKDAKKKQPQEQNSFKKES